MRLALVHARMTLLVFGRHPAFAVPTLLLPTLFFALFGLPDRRVPHPVVTASFAAYSTCNGESWPDQSLTCMVLSTV